jgi:hypothetical protein
MFRSYTPLHLSALMAVAGQLFTWQQLNGNSKTGRGNVREHVQCISLLCNKTWVVEQGCLQGDTCRPRLSLVVDIGITNRLLCILPLSVTVTTMTPDSTQRDQVA